MPPIMTLSATLTWASPPVRCPTSTRARSKRRWAIPPADISEPASMNRGMASRMKLSLALVVRAATTAIGTSWVQATPMTAVRASDATIGRPRRMRATNRIPTTAIARGPYRPRRRTPRTA